ncbi:BrnA antitoxin family protein [Sphingomonas morindae]|uniref:BrnA antitoxin family protein n=1 Tax=Sphingomonas morindae TaxID=1541170 RepID=A0ABY4X3J1_9SPHN|nr:BrnA antitoxin family protein [Sphingomonas morindae]USI71458.1 BrnA antitoxin family protein [Sphingomonas morindae]
MATDPPSPGFDENPEWTEETFARARPAGAVLAPEIVAQLVKNKGGRPAGSNKEQIAIRLDKEVVARFRDGGPGWQSRMNEALRKAVGL